MNAAGFAVVLLLSCGFCANGQTANPADWRGAIRGLVTSRTTGTPVEDVAVFTYVGSEKRSTMSEAGGRFTLTDLPAGNYQVFGNKFPSFAVSAVPVTLRQAQESRTIALRLQETAKLSGSVFDANGEPVPGIRVEALEKLYEHGECRYVPMRSGVTNDRGEYRIEGLQPGRQYALEAGPQAPLRVNGSPARKLSKAPISIASITSYYPRSPSVGGASSIVLGAGEHRQNLDFHLAPSAAFCIAGTVTDSSAADVTVHDVSGGQIRLVGSGKAAASGRFWICGLPRGEYRVAAKIADDGGQLVRFGASPVNVIDQDVEDIRVAPVPTVAVTGRVVWDAEPPKRVLTESLFISLEPLDHVAPFRGETTRASSSIPGEFALPNLLRGRYGLKVTGLDTSFANVYVKRALFGQHDLLREPFVPENSGAELQIALARDGGWATASVVDKDGAQIPAAWVAVIFKSEEGWGVRKCQTTQEGVCLITGLAPGKYYAFAPGTEVDDTPQERARLWESRASRVEIEIQPQRSTPVTLTGRQ